MAKRSWTRRTHRKKGPTAKLVYEGNKWMIKVEDKTVASGVFDIDATKQNRRRSTSWTGSGVKNEKTKLGIYELDGDTYKFLPVQAGKPRPTEFTSKSGSGHSLGVSSRQKP